MTRLQKQVHQVLSMIRNAEFDPDLDRVSRLRQMVGNDNFLEEYLPEGQDEEFFESDLSDVDLDEKEIREAQQCDDLQLEYKGGEVYQALVMNRKSSVVHAKADAGKLLCGRNHTQEYSDIPKVVQVSAFPFCSQCERAKISRFNVGSKQQIPSVALDQYRMNLFPVIITCRGTRSQTWMTFSHLQAKIVVFLIWRMTDVSSCPKWLIRMPCPMVVKVLMSWNFEPFNAESRRVQLTIMFV